jgi:hypothetical protein
VRRSSWRSVSLRDAHLFVLLRVLAVTEPENVGRVTDLDETLAECLAATA